MQKNSKEYVIKEDMIGNRLDKAIVILDNKISRMTVQRLLNEENITVNRQNRKSLI